MSLFKLITTLIRFFFICFVLSFKFFLQLLCTSLVLVVIGFIDSLTILEEVITWSGDIQRMLKKLMMGIIDLRI